MEGFSELLILMVVVWTAGKVFRTFNLPIIFGELIGGVIVGPAMLGLVDPESEMIKIIAEFGIFFLMLHSGLETNPTELLKSGKKSVSVAIGGALLPLVGAYFLATFMGYPPSTAFFIGMSISITAIPIAARLFKDHKLLNSKAGHLTVGAAIINDIIAFILFSIALSMSENGTFESKEAILLTLKTLTFFAVVIYGGMKISPFMNRVIHFNNKGFTLTLIIALLMGLIAEAIGLHMILGAFLAGLFIREEVIDKRTFEKIEDRIYGMSYSFFGPIFFASLAFHLHFASLKEMPLFLISLFLIAIVGKLIGSSLTALLTGSSKTESLAIGTAMNSRGAVELIVALIGLEKGIITQEIFSLLIFVSFAGTIFSIVTFQPVAKRLKINKT